MIDPNQKEIELLDVEFDDLDLNEVLEGLEII